MASQPPARLRAEHGSGQPPILVTGSHRAGTTWVGRVLSEGAGLGYVHEPFNPAYRGTWLRRRPAHWYQHVTEATEQPYAEDVSALLRCRYPTTARLREVRTAHDVLTIAKQQALAASYRVSRRRLLLKDPLALLATPWFVRRFDAVPVVLIRHPAAFASSLVRLDWRFDFTNFTDQPALLEQLPEAIRVELAEVGRTTLHPLHEACVLWKVLYSFVADWHEGESWAIVRHEDLAADPSSGFRELFERLGLDFGPAAAAVVRANDVEATDEFPVERRHDSRRNSTAAASTWHRRLDDDAIAAIRSSCEELSARWYGPGTWEPISR